MYYHSKTLIKKKFKQYLVFKLLEEKIHKGLIDLLDLNYKKVSFSIKLLIFLAKHYYKNH